MMNYLVDTQILLWTITKNKRLTESLLELLRNKSGENKFHVSQISLFEIAIKQKIGKMPEVSIDTDAIHQQLLADGYDFLPIANAHLNAYSRVPLYENHRDPFDRLFLATALHEKMIFISADQKFKRCDPLVTIFLVD
jgi:PIN domain nuclease of toxin-antitoxin system